MTSSPAALRRWLPLGLALALAAAARAAPADEPDTGEAAPSRSDSLPTFEIFGFDFLATPSPAAHCGRSPARTRRRRRTTSSRAASPAACSASRCTAKYLWTRRDARYPDLGDRTQTRGTLGLYYALIGPDLFGAVDWRKRNEP